MVSISNEGISKEELTKERTPSELLSWVIGKTGQIGSTDEGIATLTGATPDLPSFSDTIRGPHTITSDPLLWQRRRGLRG